MRLHRAVVVTTLLVLLTACNGTGRSSATSCTNDVCKVNLTGEQSLDIELGSVERDLQVGPIEPAAVTVSVRGDQARLAVGETATVGGLAVRLTSVSGRDVSLEVRRG